MATETAALAQNAAEPSAAEAYMNLATVWTKMADELMAKLPANDGPDTAPPEMWA